MMKFLFRWSRFRFRRSQFKSVRFVAIAAISLMATLLSLACYYPASPPAQASSILQTPLSTRGSEIIDATGRPVLLRGVNWFGLETETQAPHGLWARDYKEVLAQIKSLGYNIIRLPYSVQALRGNSISGVNFDLGSNRELQGKTPLEVMDLIVQEAGRQGLLILLDSHRLNNQRIPELWYGDGFTEADWINTWTMLAERYKNQPNVIGADLKNEPHGKASWGTNDRATDWRLAAERAGNAILKVNPNWLIVVEGVEKNVPGQRLKIHWMGGNLEGVRRFPVRLSLRNKVVYSPHEYGAGVFNQPWFSEPDFPRNLTSRWEIGFNYIARQNIAPVWVGEFGGRQIDETSKEGIWQRQFVDYLKRNRLGFAYWSWNPNSADTGGILLDDWKAIDQPKQALLNPLLPAPTLRASIEPPKISTSPVAKSRTSDRALQPQRNRDTPTSRDRTLPSRPSQLKTNLLIQSNWQAGFCTSVQITNPGQQAVQNWQLKFNLKQAEIDQSWNGTFKRQGTEIIVTPPEWGRTMQPSQTIDLGFCAKKLGRDYLPSQLEVIAR